MKSQTLRLLEEYRAAKVTWASLYQASKDTVQDTRNGALDIGGMADAALLLKRILGQMDDARKEVNKAIAQLESTACLLYAQMGQGGPIRGEICRASVRPGMEPPTLKREENPELHTEIMKYFGFSQESAEKELARLHWPNVESHMADLMASGKPLPDCLKGLSLKSTFKLTCSCQSGIDLDVLANAPAESRVADEYRPSNAEPGPAAPPVSDIPF